MEPAREYTITVLKELLNLCKEERSLFVSAIEKLEDNSVKQNFQNYIKEKTELICKTESEIKRLGGSLENLEGINSFNQNIPSDKKSNSEEDTIVHYCLEKDDSILDRYSFAMNEDIMWEVVPFIAKQYFDSKNLHERILFNCVIKRQQNLALGNVS